MQFGELARKYTDIDYISKKELTNRLGISVADNVWRQINDYREKYRFPLEIKKYDRIPFSIVLTPALMEIPTSTERLMFNLTLKYNHLKTLESFSDTKSVERFIKNIIKEDLQVIAHSEDVILSEKDIDIMLAGSSVHLKDSHVFRYYQTLKMLMENKQIKLDKNIFREILKSLNPNFDEDSALLYRVTEPKVSSDQLLLGAPLNRIGELINALFDFVESDFPLSPFINASVFYIYLLYISPFEKYNHEIATLLFSKLLADSGYGEISYLLSLNEFLVQRQDDFNSIFDEIKRSGDITYGVVFVSRLIYEAINWRLKNLEKVEAPKPIYSEVNVIEKIVEKIVEKEVPIYIEKSSDKKTVNDKPIQEKIQEITNENTSNEAEYFLKMGEAEKQNKPLGEKFEFIDDPFVKFAEVNPTTTPEIVDKVVKPIKTKKLKNIEPNPEPIVSSKLDIKHLQNLEEEDFAKQLTEMNPLIKYHQALFYFNHRVVGHYYTISQFKDFADCAYETARTSMDFLTSLGLYRKEQVKNKFVYTPNDLGGKK
jgi:hypothetical protein